MNEPKENNSKDYDKIKESDSERGEMSSSIHPKSNKNDEIDSKRNAIDDNNSDSNRHNEYNDVLCKENNDSLNNVNKNIVALSPKKPVRVKRIKGRFFFKRLGNTLAMLSDKEGNPLFIIGPDWPIYLCLMSFVIIAMVIYLVYLSEKCHIVLRVLGMIVFSLFYLSYTLTFLINPGYPKNTIGRHTGRPKNEYHYCSRCFFYCKKDKDVVHCDDCNICVEGYDHHCPWTSKCIGNGNICFFHWFLISLVSVFGFLIFVLASRE